MEKIDISDWTDKDVNAFFSKLLWTDKFENPNTFYNCIYELNGKLGLVEYCFCKYYPTIKEIEDYKNGFCQFEYINWDNINMWYIKSYTFMCVLDSKNKNDFGEDIAKAYDMVKFRLRREKIEAINNPPLQKTVIWE